MEDKAQDRHDDLHDEPVRVVEQVEVVLVLLAGRQADQHDL